MRFRRDLIRPLPCGESGSNLFQECFMITAHVIES
jgi:hypothetical protein